MPQLSLYRIGIDEKWSLIDLYQFPHAYTQVYAFIYSLSGTGPMSDAAVAEIYRRYPWRGGYSAVGFYWDLYYAMEKEHRPMVNSIRYSSPGYIEIGAIAIVATQIKRIVKTVAECIEIADATYDRIYKRAQKRKLLALDVKRQQREFEREEIQFMITSSQELSKLLEFEGLESLQSRTQDQLGTLKILLSFYRRVRELAEFYHDRKITFNADTHQISNKSSSGPSQTTFCVHGVGS